MVGLKPHWIVVHKHLKCFFTHMQVSRLECVIENHFSYFSTKIYVLGAAKNRLNETVLCSTQYIYLN